MTSRYPVGIVLALVLHTTALWATMPDELAAAAGVPDPGTTAAVVREVVRTLLDS